MGIFWGKGGTDQIILQIYLENFTCSLNKKLSTNFTLDINLQILFEFIVLEQIAMNIPVKYWLKLIFGSSTNL